MLRGAAVATLAVLGAGIGLVASGVAKTPGQPGARVAAATQLRTGAQVVARAHDPASAGKTFLLRSGDYGDVDLRGAGQSALVTFRAYPGEHPVFHYTQIANTRNIRLEGLRIRAAIDIQPGTNRQLQIVGNDIGGYTGVGINAREDSSEILIYGNRFHDLRQTGGDATAGYGVRFSSPSIGISRVAVVGNTFERLGNDAMEFGGVKGLLIARNRVSGVQIEAGSDAHSDPLFVWAGTRDATIRENVFLSNSQSVYLRGGTANVSFENNLVAGIDQYCMQVGGKGLPDDGIDGLVIRGNTIYGCGFGGILYSAAAKNWTLRNNVVQSLNAGPPVSRFGHQDHNLIGSGPRTSSDLSGTPRFLNRARSDYRLAAGSPGIDAAESTGASSLDIRGVSRSDDPDVRNTGAGRFPFFDVGAYERFVAPRLSGLRIRRKGKGARVSFSLSIPAVLAYTISRRVKVRCTKHARKKRCVKRKRAGGYFRAGKAGFNYQRVQRKFGKRKLLARRNYRLEARAFDAVGNATESRRAKVRLARR